MERMSYARECGTVPGIDAFRRLEEAGGGMSKVSKYRQHAKECRSLAKTVRFSQHREMLLNMAAAWESLAQRSHQDRGRAGANCQTRKSGAEEP
jgi:hypothetical protein